MRMRRRGRSVCACACACSCACAGAAVMLLLLLAAVTADDEKMMEMSPMPFMIGSRYGRNAEPRLLVPRNDRFFMVSRYGKRSGQAAAGGAGGAGAAGAGEGGARGARPRTGGHSLMCHFTGVPHLYRCAAHNYDKRSAEESGSPEEE